MSTAEPRRSALGKILLGGGGLVVVAAATLVALSMHQTAAVPGPASSSSPTAAPVATPTATPAATPAPPLGCTFSSSLGQPNSYAGHSVVTVILTNTGTSACDLNGYPTVHLSGPNGPVGSIAETQGGGQAATATPSAVSVAAGAKANFIVEFTDVGSGGGACPSVTKLGIELPSSAGDVVQTLAYALQPCPPTFAVGAITAGG